MALKQIDKGTYLPQLDIVRFIAALMIVLLHSYEGWCANFGEIPFFKTGTAQSINTIGRLSESFIETFRLGVNVFFLISGFLITFILLEEKKKINSISLKNFFAKRILRIWPLYFLIISLTPLITAWVNVAPPNYMPNLLFITNFSIIKTHIWPFPLEHLWSICIEEHFYLVWPFIIYLVPLKKLIYFFYSFLIISIAYQIWIACTSTNFVLILYLNSLCRADVLIIGAITAYYYSKNRFIIKVPGIIRLLLYALLLGYMFIHPGYKEPLFKVTEKYLYILLIGFAMLNYNFNPNAKLQLRNNKVLHYLGKISYGIYMYGNIIVALILKKVLISFNTINIYLYLIFVLIIPIAVSALSYEFFESFFLKQKKKFEIKKVQSS